MGYPTSLPPEVLELMLAPLPLQEMLTSSSLVCRLWRDVVLRPLYLPHTKLYWRYKLGEEGTVTKLEAEVTDGIQGEDGPQLEAALPWLLNHFSEPDFTCNLVRSGQDLLPLLPRHARHPLALALLWERFPSLVAIPTTPVVVLALIVITASTVQDVTSAIQLCLSPVSSKDSVLILDLFHHLATLLLVLETKFHLPPRHHYLLHHALALHQAAWTHDPSHTFCPRTVGGSAEAPSVPLTSEQRTIVNLPLRTMLGSGDTVRIMAYAGTGKTTTLVELTRRNPGVRFLLVVFNNSVARHSENVFPRDNVTVRTAHSLSYRYITKTEEFKRFVPYGLKYTDLIEKGLLPHRNTGKGSVWEGFSLYHRAAMLMQTLQNFYMSVAERVEVRDTPAVWTVGRSQKVEKTIPEGARSQLAEDAWEVWRKIVGGRHSTAKFDHNSGMKKFQLARPTLANWVHPENVRYDYDVLLLDEAQDMNPAMLDICLLQRKPKVVVGDPHQQIYSFNGAVNALELVQDHSETKVLRTCYLTQSFRSVHSLISFTTISSPSGSGRRSPSSPSVVSPAWCEVRVSAPLLWWAAPRQTASPTTWRPRSSRPWPC